MYFFSYIFTIQIKKKVDSFILLIQTKLENSFSSCYIYDFVWMILDIHIICLLKIETNLKIRYPHAINMISFEWIRSTNNMIIVHKNKHEPVNFYWKSSYQSFSIFFFGTNSSCYLLFTTMSYHLIKDSSFY